MSICCTCSTCVLFSDVCDKLRTRGLEDTVRLRSSLSCACGPSYCLPMQINNYLHHNLAYSGSLLRACVPSFCAPSLRRGMRHVATSRNSCRPAKLALPSATRRPSQTCMFSKLGLCEVRLGLLRALHLHA
jgi:hypothetical protein